MITAMLTPADHKAAAWPWQPVITTEYTVVRERRVTDWMHLAKFGLLMAWLGAPAGLIAVLVARALHLPGAY